MHLAQKKLSRPMRFLPKRLINVGSAPSNFGRGGEKNQMCIRCRRTLFVPRVNYNGTFVIFVIISLSLKVELNAAKALN